MQQCSANGKTWRLMRTALLSRTPSLLRRQFHYLIIPRVINRVWTDVAANAVVGTKGLMGSRYNPDADLDKRSLDPLTGASKAQMITVFKRRIRYHWPFAIPAFIVILAFLATIASAIAVCLTNRFGLGSLKAVLHKTSIGRILGGVLYPEGASSNSKTSAWIQRVGKVEVDFSNEYPKRSKELETSQPLMQRDSAPLSD